MRSQRNSTSESPRVHTCGRGSRGGEPPRLVRASAGESADDDSGGRRGRGGGWVGAASGEVGKASRKHPSKCIGGFSLSRSAPPSPPPLKHAVLRVIFCGCIDCCPPGSDGGRNKIRPGFATCCVSTCARVAVTRYRKQRCASRTRGRATRLAPRACTALV